MRIKYGKQIDTAEIPYTIDLFLFAGNHEKRVFTAYKKVRQVCEISKALMLCYKKEYKCPDEYVGIENKHVGSNEELIAIIDECLSSIDKEKLTIFVDYSCMTKSWYYSIILFLSNKDISKKDVTVIFSYSPSKYSPPRDPKSNTIIAPLPGKYFVPTDKPKALIVCLGYEQNKAEGIIDHLDPKISYLFYTKPALDDRFVKTLEKNNKTIIKNSKTEIIKFPFDDLLFLERELTSLYYLLRDDYSIIIAPLGPKPFTFIAMLLAVRHSEIDIWRVGSGSDINEYPREPISDEKFIITKVVWG